jgi:cyclopropane fatty-acyl-phospholipid synthase-like methyltransferase
MNKYPTWQYDEMKYSGVDFNDPAVASEYDERFKELENFEETAKQILETVGLSRGSTVIDIGCGTGLFVLYAAKWCKNVHAVDVSEQMLDICKTKAKQQGLNNIDYHHAGFLTYEHSDEPVDAVISTKALHHLPDFWKSAAILRIYKMLKPQGRFYLEDLVYSFEPGNYVDAISLWIEQIVNIQGPEFRPRMETAIRQEYKTFNWIIEGLLEKAGFKIENIDYKDNYRAGYLCAKENNE